SAFRLHFTEGRDAALAPHLATSVLYRRAVRDLARLVGCEPEEEALLAARRARPPEEHARALFHAANLSALLVDTGFGGPESYSLAEMERLAGAPVREVLRLETLAEALILETDSFAEMEEAYRHRLNDARARGSAALKTIAAYRGGLEVEPRTREEAAAAYP